MNSTTLNALAVVVAEASGGRWDARGIAAVLSRLTDARPIGQIAAAALYAAEIRTDQTSPACIVLDGEHWRAFDHMIGRAQGPITPVPTYGCPYHAGQPRDCPVCAEHARQVADQRQVAGHMATIRDAIRAARPDHSDDQDQPCPTTRSDAPPATNPHPEPASKSTSTANSGPATATESAATSPSAASKSPA